MVFEIIFKANKFEPLEEEEDLINTLHENCQVDTQSKVEIVPTHNIFGMTKTQTSDYPSQIPYHAISRYFPGTLEEPYHKVDRALYLGPQSFALVLFNPEKIMYDKDLHYYERSKYQMVYEFVNVTEKQDETYTDNHPMVWLELLCIGETQRGKGYGAQFLEEVLVKVKTHYDERVKLNGGKKLIVGVDIPGTKNGHVNGKLKKFYEKMGFEFAQPVPGSGSITGYRLL